METFANYQAASGEDAHSIEGSPNFVDPANHDYHLLYNSPAINYGMNSGLPRTTTAPPGARRRLRHRRVRIHAPAHGPKRGGQRRQCQRSRVTGLTVNFSKIVAMDAGAFEVLSKGAGQLVTVAVASTVQGSKTVPRSASAAV